MYCWCMYQNLSDSAVVSLKACGMTHMYVGSPVENVSDSVDVMLETRRGLLVSAVYAH